METDRITLLESHLLENLNEFVGFARRRIGNPELAADAVQDSLLKALKAADQIRNKESAKACSTGFFGGLSSISTAGVMRAIESSPNSSMSSDEQRHQHA